MCEAWGHESTREHADGSLDKDEGARDRAFHVSIVQVRAGYACMVQQAGFTDEHGVRMRKFKILHCIHP